MCISLPHVALKTEMCMRTCVVRVCVSRFPSSARHQSALNFSEVELRLAKTFFLIILLMHWNSTCPASLPPCFISCPIPCVPARFHACCLLIVCLRLSRVCTLEQYAPCAHRFGFFLSPPPLCHSLPALPGRVPVRLRLPVLGCGERRAALVACDSIRVLPLCCGGDDGRRRLGHVSRRRTHGTCCVVCLKTNHRMCALTPSHNNISISHLRPCHPRFLTCAVRCLCDGCCCCCDWCV